MNNFTKEDLYISVSILFSSVVIGGSLAICHDIIDRVVEKVDGVDIRESLKEGKTIFKD